MREEIISILICPQCKSSLRTKTEKVNKGRIQKGILECKKCDTNFKIIDEILCFKSVSNQELNDNEKIEKTQKMFLKQELKKKWLKHFPKKELIALKEEWKWMIDQLNPKNSKIHVEWASGTGRFLRNILGIIRGEIIALEYDYATCLGLRDFLKKIKKYSKVTIICCDAQKMPIDSNSVNSTSSWHGLDEPKISKAIGESYRILKKNGKLVTSGLYFRKDSKSLKVALENGIKLTKKDATYRYFKKLGFQNINYKEFFSGKWTESTSFLPKKGDYFTSYGVSGKK